MVDRTANLLRLHVDGYLFSTTSIAGAGSVDNSAALQLGARGGADFYSGDLDDARIYDRAVTTLEIAQIYDALSGDFNGSLIARWPFDETTGTIITDGISGNNGTFSGGANIISASARQNTGIEFDGVDDGITIFASASLDNIAPFTSCLWMNADSYPTANPVLMNKALVAGTNGWEIALDSASNGVRIRTNQQGLKTFNADINLGEWTHLCAAWDGSDGTDGISLYKNGAPVTSIASQSDGGSANADDSTRTLGIGLSLIHI